VIQDYATLAGLYRVYEKPVWWAFGQPSGTHLWVGRAEIRLLHPGLVKVNVVARPTRKRVPDAWPKAPETGFS
jgi:hypothetical protein